MDIKGIVGGEEFVRRLGLKLEYARLDPDIDGLTEMDKQRVVLRRDLLPHERSVAASHEAAESMSELLAGEKHESWCDCLGDCLLMPRGMMRRSLRRYTYNLDALQLAWWIATQDAIARRIGQVVPEAVAKCWDGHRAVWTSRGTAVNPSVLASSLEAQLLSEAYYRGRGRAYGRRGPWEGWAYRTNDLPHHRGLTVLLYNDLAEPRIHWEPDAVNELDPDPVLEADAA